MFIILTFIYLFQASKTVDKSGFEAYDKTRAPPSRLPPRHFCTACGFFSKYTCITCGARYCSISCRDLHNDTRLIFFLID